MGRVDSVASSYRSNPPPTLDEARLAALMRDLGGDPSIVREVIHSFLEEARSLMGDMHQALQAGDSVRLGRAAHSLKGASASLGAQRVSEVAARLEASAPNLAREQAAELVAQLDAAVLDADEALRARLEAQG